MNWWFAFSLIAGVLVLLLDLLRHQKKRGEPWLGKNPKATLAFFIPLGMLTGWFAFYHLPPRLADGFNAFVTLYNDPRAPLYWLLPGLITFLTAMAMWHYGTKVYRRHKSARAKSSTGTPSWNLLMAVVLWTTAFALVIIAFYLQFRLVPR